MKLTDIPRFDNIPVPVLVGVFNMSGIGSKVFQAYLDNHPKIYMKLAYPLVYYYPHRDLWEHR